MKNFIRPTAMKGWVAWTDEGDNGQNVVMMKAKEIGWIIDKGNGKTLIVNRMDPELYWMVDNHAAEVIRAIESASK